MRKLLLIKIQRLLRFCSILTRHQRKNERDMDATDQCCSMSGQHSVYRQPSTYPLRVVGNLFRSMGLTVLLGVAQLSGPERLLP
jgi:hypothetical protein